MELKPLQLITPYEFMTTRGVVIKFLVMLLVLSSFLSGCEKATNIPPERNVYIPLKNHELDGVLEKVRGFVRDNNLNKEDVSVDIIADPLRRYRNAALGERTVFEIYSKIMSDVRVTFMVRNHQLYCGLDLRLSFYGEDTRYDFIEIFDSFISELSEKYPVEPFNEASTLRKKVRIGVAPSNNECI